MEDELRRNPLDAKQTRALLFILNGEGNHLRELGELEAVVPVRARALEVAEEALAPPLCHHPIST